MNRPRLQAPFLALLALGLASPVSTAQKSTRLAPPLRQHALADASGFSGDEVRIDFDALLPGTPVGPQFLFLGVAIEAESGRAPRAWMDDGAPRPGGAPGGVALRNATGHQAHLGEFSAVSPATALRLGFARRVNRVGFEVRGLTRATTLLLTPLRNGHAQGQHAFAVDTNYSFVGLESSRPFGELRVSCANPGVVDVSLDGLRFEYDVRDADGDGIPDFADGCSLVFDPAQGDADGDGRGDRCDPFPLDPDDDADGDGLGADLDNCPGTFNPDQRDSDGDGVGDACTPFLAGNDSDGDGVPDGEDNCPLQPNPGQEDCDADGQGDACDLSFLEPASVDLTMPAGASYTVQKALCLPAAAPRIDVVFALDATHGMASILDELRSTLLMFASELRASTPGDVQFGMVSFRDYTGPYSSCGASTIFGGGDDYPFRVDAGLGASDAELATALDDLVAANGGDGAEAYGRALWELAQEDSGIDWRPGARRIVLVTADSVPHDCDVAGSLPNCTFPLSTGIDPGRDEILFTGDDIDFQFGALAGLMQTEATLIALVNNTQTILCLWEAWCGVTGGLAIQALEGRLPDGVDLTGTVLQLASAPPVDRLDFVPDPGCPLDITFTPPFLTGPFDSTVGHRLALEETIRVPADLPPGTYSCTVQVLADGAPLAEQTVRVTVDCPILGFEGRDNGHAIRPEEFDGLGVRVTSSGLDNHGAAVFDSNPVGPNTGGSDADLLVGQDGILILQENGAQSVAGIFDNPDDAQLGGSVMFTFAEPSELLSIDLIDIDQGPPLQTVTLTLTDGMGHTRTYLVPDGWTRDLHVDGPPGLATLDLTTLDDQPGFAGTATASEDPDFDALDARTLEVRLSSSGALDNLRFCP